MGKRKRCEPCYDHARKCIYPDGSSSCGHCLEQGLKCAAPPAACQNCRAKKRKCDGKAGDQNCSRCQKKGIRCTKDRQSQDTDQERVQSRDPVVRDQPGYTTGKTFCLPPCSEILPGRRLDLNSGTEDQTSKNPHQLFWYTV